jgi:hypothetical protein
MQIGWNDRFILVDRKASFGGDKDGWMIIDTVSGTIVGPLTNDELKSHTGVSDIHPHKADEAWSMLH